MHQINIENYFEVIAINKNDSFIYRCNYCCPIGKKCFIFKTTKKIRNGFTVLFKCKARKQEIEIPILGLNSQTCK